VVDTEEIPVALCTARYMMRPAHALRLPPAFSPITALSYDDFDVAMVASYDTNWITTAA